MMNEIRLVLVGGGHAHVHVLKKLRRLHQARLKVMLVSCDTRQYYSGMAAGFLEGVYGVEDYSFHLPSLCARSGVRFIEDEVVMVDTSQKRVHTKGGLRLPYEVLSIDTGSDLRSKDIPGSTAHAFMIKPFANLSVLKTLLQAKETKPTRMVIIGGGAAGVELACVAACIAHRKQIVPDITIVDPWDGIMRGYPLAARLSTQSTLESLDVKLVLKSRVTSINASEVRTIDNKSIPYDLAIWATGTQAHGFLRASGLPVDENGYLRVDRSLRCIDHPEIFGAGDCIAFTPRPSLPKNGVHAIRQAPILVYNLLSYLRGGCLRSYHPRNTYLSIVSFAAGQALVSYGRLSMKGHLAWLVKDWIDRRYMRTYGVRLI